MVLSVLSRLCMFFISLNYSCSQPLFVKYSLSNFQGDVRFFGLFSFFGATRILLANCGHIE